MKKIDLIGLRFGTFTVTKYMNIGHNSRWLCVCDCGLERSILGMQLRANRAKCVCQKYLHHHPLYATWTGMKSRCGNIKSPDYKRYGGRGITICERWLHSFENFLADMGERPEGLTLDRRKNDEGYSPNNCRWATQKEQSSNTRRNIILTHNGKTMTVMDWSKELNISAEGMRQRLECGWPEEKIFYQGKLGRGKATRGRA